jgi:hypothetical protein
VNGFCLKLAATEAVDVDIAKTPMVANDKERAEFPRNSRLFISVTASFIENSIS